jgi:hypothetical protein
VKDQRVRIDVPEPIKKWIDYESESRCVSTTSFVRQLIVDAFNKSSFNEIHFDQYDLILEKFDLDNRTLTILLYDEMVKSLNLKSNRLKVRI